MRTQKKAADLQLINLLKSKIEWHKKHAALHVRMDWILYLFFIFCLSFLIHFSCYNVTP